MVSNLPKLKKSSSENIFLTDQDALHFAHNFELQIKLRKINLNKFIIYTVLLFICLPLQDVEPACSFSMDLGKNNRTRLEQI